MRINWKGFGRKWSWPNFKVLTRHSPEGTEKTMKDLNQDSRSPGMRIEPGTSQIRSRSVNHSTTTFGHPIVIIIIIAKQHILYLIQYRAP
jgi:hypothetical protein